ncbi:MAG: gliding motility-associated C-terminal domain-containing protein, partial [Bacteroidia bacterium]|nr:gliding motility-associated C-terminal domain-containing protein [Bacteroidia bacterium]MDW8134032.1 gliding motility-associated C-terminal domain-containing protein [Bacteroidia bacterium]
EMFFSSFPNSMPVSPGKVQLRGGYQWIVGSDPIHFDSLELRGTSSKNLAQAVYVRHVLDLGDHMLNTHAETLHHRNASPGSIVRGQGFIRSSLGGALERECVAGERYLYPLGDSLPILRYRPLYWTASGNGRYAARFASVDATQEGYDRTQRDSRLCLINPDFFHHFSGPQGGLLEIAFDRVQDGAYDAAAHWNGVRWDSVGGTLISFGGFEWMTQFVHNLMPSPFALALRQPQARIIPPGPHSLCPGDSLLLAVENPNSLWTYTWSHGPLGTSAWIKQEGIYTVTVEGAMGCSSVSEPVVVQLLSEPGVSVSPASPVGICPGDSLKLTASPAFAYQWFYEGLPLIGANDSVIWVKEPGSYFVQAQQICGSAESEPFLLFHYSLPQAYFTIQPTETVYVGQEVLFVDSTQGGRSWMWYVNGIGFSGSSTLSYVFLKDTLHLVILISRNETGCQDTFMRYVYVRPFRGIFIPTAFTPNGDGINDEFLIVSPPLEWSELRIYSRWGLLIREMKGALKWDGKDAQGMYVPEDVYTFVFRARLFSGQVIERVGTVSVLY